VERRGGRVEPDRRRAAPQILSPPARSDEPAASQILSPPDRPPRLYPYFL